MIDAFDRFVAIDFSASSRPSLGRDSLWVGWSSPRGPIRTRNVATRRELLDLIATLIFTGERTLVVLDIALGWPTGTASALGLDGTPWRAMRRWLMKEVRDADDNDNNRFEVAAHANLRANSALFWGHPRGRRYDGLAPTTAVPDGLRPRVTEGQRTIERVVGGTIKSPFQLTGAGAVGSQSLLGQVFVERLAREGHVQQWPFETRPATVVVGEYFFSLPSWRDERGAVRDEQQVRAVVRWLRGCVESGQALTSSSLLKPLTSATRSLVREEEGWLVGVVAPPGV